MTGIDLEAIVESFGITALVAAITKFADTITGINWFAPGALMDAIGAFITLAQDLGNWVLQVIEAWLGWSFDVVHAMFDTADAFVDALVKFFFGQGGLDTWNKIQEALGGVGAGIWGAIEGAYNGVVGLVNAIGSFLNIQGLVDFVDGILGGKGLLGWLSTIPIIGPIVTALTGIQPKSGVALDMSTLSTWAGTILTKKDPVPAGNLFGQIPASALGTIPVSAISNTVVNLLGQGNFNNADTVEAGGGVDWDGATTATGSGGSMRFTGTGAMQRRFSRQVIPVAVGDRIKVAAMVKTAGFVPAAGRLIMLSVVPWVGNVSRTDVAVSVKASSQPEFVALSDVKTIVIGKVAADFTHDSVVMSTTSTEVVLASQVTALTVAVTAVLNVGATAWVDDAGIAKTGALDQGHVDQLPQAWEGLYTGLTGDSGTGKTSSTMQAAATATRQKAGTAQTTADTATGKATAAQGRADSAHTRQDTTNNLLFKVPNPASTAQLDVDVLPIDDLSSKLLDAGSGGRMSRRNTANKINLDANSNTNSGPLRVTFEDFYDSPASDALAATSDIAANREYGAFTVTYAGWYEVEVGFTTNADHPGSGAFCVAPAVFVGTGVSTTNLHKVGASAFGSWGLGLGGYARSGHSTFLVQLAEGQTVRAGYYNFYSGSGAAIANFFQGDTAGVSTYFSISMLNRTQEG